MEVEPMGAIISSFGILLVLAAFLVLAWQRRYKITRKNFGRFRSPLRVIERGLK